MQEVHSTIYTHSPGWAQCPPGTACTLRVEQTLERHDEIKRTTHLKVPASVKAELWYISSRRSRSQADTASRWPCRGCRSQGCTGGRAPARRWGAAAPPPPRPPDRSGVPSTCRLPASETRERERERERRLERGRLLRAVSLRGERLTPCRPGRTRCGAGSSPSWSRGAWAYTQPSPQLKEKHSVEVTTRRLSC